MFKYISEILKNFSGPQRLIVLILLLIFISIIYVLPKYFEMSTHNDVDLIAKIERQRKEIEDLDKMIRNDKMECTNKIIQRENEILVLISDLEKGLKSTKRPIRAMMVHKVEQEDTLNIVRSVSVVENENTNNDDKVLHALKKIKDNLKSHIKNN